jgi:Tol biopolymer transport system component
LLHLQPRWIPAILALTLAAAAIPAAELERINRTEFTGGGSHPGGAISHFETTRRTDMTPDGALLAFALPSTAVVPGLIDLNGRNDIFVKDLQKGSIRLVSHALGIPGRTGNGASERPRISAHGRFVAFLSQARDLAPLVPEGPSTLSRLYRHDLELGTTQLAVHQAGDPTLSVDPGADFEMSSDGRFLLFASADPGDLLVPGLVDTNDEADIFLWDAATDTYQLVTRLHGQPTSTAQGAAASTDARVISDDGRFVAFLSDDPSLVAVDAPATVDVLLFDRQKGVNSIASRPNGDSGAIADANALAICDLSADGRYLLFTSAASNMVAGITDTNGASDLFLFDRVAGTVEVISKVPSPGNASAGGGCGWLDDDALFVYFLSSAGNLVAGVTDTNLSPDLFLHHRELGLTWLLSHVAGSPTQAAGGLREQGNLMSADGRTFLLWTSNQSLVNGSYLDAPFSLRYDRDTDAIGFSLVRWDASASTLVHKAVNLSAGGGAGVFITPYPSRVVQSAGSDRDGASLVQNIEGENALVSAAAFSGSGSPGIPFTSGASMAADASKVAFRPGSKEVCGGSGAGALCVYTPSSQTLVNINHRFDDPEVLLEDVLGPLGVSGAGGRYVLAHGRSFQLTPGDNNGTGDLFLYDTQQRTFELISRRSSNPIATANGNSEQFVTLRGDLMTLDASQVAFESQATNLVAGTDPNGTKDVFLRDRPSGTTQLVSRKAGGGVIAGNGRSEYPVIASLGGYVSFASEATDLVDAFVDGNGNLAQDLFLFDAENDAMQLVSHAAGAPGRGGNSRSATSSVFVSANGRFVLHGNSSSDLVVDGHDSNGFDDVFLFDRATGENTLVSRSLQKPTLAANGHTLARGLSSDGRHVLFASSATDILPGISSGTTQLYLWDRLDGSVPLVSHRQGQPDVPLDAGAEIGSLTPDASRVLFGTASAHVLPGIEDTNEATDLFVWERATGNIELLTPSWEDPARTAANGCSVSSLIRKVSDDGKTIFLDCSAPDLMPYDNNSGADLFLARLTNPLFSDGFETGDTSRWSAATP